MDGGECGDRRNKRKGGDPGAAGTAFSRELPRHRRKAARATTSSWNCLKIVSEPEPPKLLPRGGRRNEAYPQRHKGRTKDTRRHRRGKDENRTQSLKASEKQ